ncbi:MAG TPA: hypothetical protein ENF70_07105 [Deltaproteobacteria bacterium]|nr:MAG: hypothetical protein DRG82_16520 [Deltaproteobacteria bacterium]HDH98881.1 hypothetical protein [Deltaproteobacteria bacterium]
MAQRINRRKCKHCGKLFLPDHRNATRQRYCTKPECRKASKASSQKRWLQKPENRDYFRGPDNVERVQLWRKGHPGYWRRKQENTSTALQDPLNQQLPENNGNRDDFVSHGLQDSLILQPTVFIGLIAQLTGYALQEDIAMAARHLQQLGNDILNPQLKGGSHGRKTSDLSSAYPQNPKTLQLAGSSPGQ